MRVVVLDLAQSPVGGEIKTCDGVRYAAADFSTEPRWGRDQNVKPWMDGLFSLLAQSPVGGEIKTTLRLASLIGSL